MYVCMYVCMYVYVSMYVHNYICMYTFILDMKISYRKFTNGLAEYPKKCFVTSLLFLNNAISVHFKYSISSINLHVLSLLCYLHVYKTYIK